MKGILNKDELGKPFIEYISEVSYNTQFWRVNKKFNQFVNFHKSLKNMMGSDFKFPESTKIFIKIGENTNFHENKIKQLETYIREISDIPLILNSRIFRKFFEFHLNTDEYILNENFNNSEKTSFFKSPNRKSKISKSGSEDNSDFNEDGKISNNLNTFRNSSNCSTQKNNLYADSEGKITFENNFSSRKNRNPEN